MVASELITAWDGSKPASSARVDFAERPSSLRRNLLLLVFFHANVYRAIAVVRIQTQISTVSPTTNRKRTADNLRFHLPVGRNSPDFMSDFD